jgi:hypothetical protein
MSEDRRPAGTGFNGGPANLFGDLTVGVTVRPSGFSRPQRRSCFRSRACNGGRI